MSIALLRHWLGADAPSPHDTELKRAVRDALIEHDAVLAEARLDEEGWHTLAVDAVRALEALESCIAWSDSMQQWVCVGRERLQPAIAMARSALEEATACRCCECGALLSVSNEEKRPYVALPGDVVAYSTHCREHAYQELASAPESPPRIAGKTADFDPPGREYTTGDALGLRRDR